MKVIEFRVQESKKNKGMFLLIANVEWPEYPNGRAFVVAGDPVNPHFVVPIEQCWDIEEELKGVEKKV
jgi:hypothetical protein